MLFYSLHVCICLSCEACQIHVDEGKDINAALFLTLVHFMLNVAWEDKAGEDKPLCTEKLHATL